MLLTIAGFVAIYTVLLVIEMKLMLKAIRKGPDDHDPFNAKVQHPGAFADQLAHGGKDQRRGDADGSDPERGGEEDFKRFHYRHLIRYRESMMAVTMVSSEVATITSAM